MANIPIGNNIIYMQKEGSSETKDTVETVLLGAERIDVGVKSGNKEIATDAVTGYHYERDEIIGKTVYELKSQKRGCIFALDLETGQRGWYPGAIRIADIVGSADIKAEKSLESETIITVYGEIVKILDVEYDDDKNIWYNVSYKSGADEFIGYVQSTKIANIRYSDPY